MAFAAFGFSLACIASIFRSPEAIASIGLGQQFPLESLGAPGLTDPSCPVNSMPASSFQLQHNLGHKKGGAGKVDQPSRGSLHRASCPQAQEQEKLLFEPTPLRQLAFGEGTEQTKSLAESNLPLQHALEGITGQKLQEVPPPTQLWIFMLQLGNEITSLHQVVANLAELIDSRLRSHSLDEELGEDCAKHSDNNKNNNTDDDSNNNNNTHNNNHTHNNNNNDSNNNKSSQVSGLNSLDLDNENPESEPDLDTTSLVSFNPEVGSESSSWSLDHEEADLSLTNLGHMMAIGSSLRSLDQNNGQQRENKGTAWAQAKPKKRVSFGKVTFAAYTQNNDKQQNNGQQQKSSQLGKLEQKTKNNKENSCKPNLGKHNELPNIGCKTTLACWNLVPQEHPKKKRAWQDGPSTMQQQPNTDNSLDGEEVTLGSLEAEPQATKLAYRSPKHNTNNTSSLGLGTKNTATYGILNQIDTGAAISLAPRSFAQDVELSPIESTLNLRTVTGEAIEAFGRRTVQLVGSNLSFHVSFVIANVQHALLGMDALMSNQLSLVRNTFNEYYLVNTAGATTQLQSRGHLLYIEACPREFGFSNCRGSSLPKENGSLLDDKVGTQEGVVPASGGACDNSFYLENLRQQQDKNTAALGTTALPEKGAKKRKRRKKKKPSAKKASQEHHQRSLEQQGQKPAATHLRSLDQTRIIKEIELAAEENKEGLGSITIQELSLRILLTLSLRNKWLITTTRATGACTEDALGKHLKNIGLDQNKMDQNIFQEMSLCFCCTRETS